MGSRGGLRSTGFALPNPKGTARGGVAGFLSGTHVHRTVLNPRF